MNAFASFDIESMEKLLKFMEADSSLPMDWHVYPIAAKGYLKFGQFNKSLAMLTKTENYINERTYGVTYEILITLYARLGRKDDVYRIWDIYKKTWRKVSNRGYHHMISALVKLDDIDGAEKKMAEWESINTVFEFWVFNVLLNAYIKNGEWKKAENYVDRVVTMGKQPPASTWDCLATAYVRENQMEKAVETMRKAIFAYNNGWKLNRVTLIACVEYLEHKGNLGIAEEFVKVIGDERRKSVLTTG